MSARLVALDEGPDIPLDRAMLIVGRHPQCDTRLDSIRVSRRHCCMSPDNGEVVVRDLGSTNGIRINGQRVEMGRLKPGDELSIAHIRYRLEDGAAHEPTLADPARAEVSPARVGPGARKAEAIENRADAFENPLAAAVRDLLPAAMADRCRIRVIVQMHPETDAEDQEDSAQCQPNSSP